MSSMVRPVLLAPRSGRASGGECRSISSGIAGEIWTTYDSSRCDFREETDDDRLQPRRTAALTVDQLVFSAQTKPGEGMEPIADARREVALEIQKLAEDFERDDEAAFRRTRIACWIVVAIVTIIILGLLIIGGDGRYLGVFWLIIVGLTWAGYALSSRRQRQQTGRLKALATRWLSAAPTVSRDRGVGPGVPPK